MQKHFILIASIIFFYGCSNQSELSKNFNCQSSTLENTTQIFDFNKNFKLNIPVSWKTELYYDKYTSEIFTADTIKQLSDTFILDASYNLGEVIFNEEFFAKNNAIAGSENFEIIKSEISLFQSKESYWYVLKGTKNNFPYQQFNLTVKLSNNTYFNSYVEIYGDDNIDARICQAISILDNIEFLQ